MQFGPPRPVRCEHCGEGFTVDQLLSGNTFGATQWSDGFLDAPMYPLAMTVPFFRCAACRQFSWRRDDSTPTAPRAPRKLDALGPDDFYDAVAAHIWRNLDEERTVRRLAWWYGNHARRPALSRATGGVGCQVSLAGLFVMAASFLAWGHLSTTVTWLGLAAGVAMVATAWYRIPHERRLAEAQRRREIEAMREVEVMREVDPSRAPYRDDPADVVVRRQLDPRMHENLLALDALLDEHAPDERMERVEIARELGRFDAAQALLDGGAWRPEDADAVAVQRTLVDRGNHRVVILRAG